MDQLGNKIVERGEGATPPATNVEWRGCMVLTILSIPLYGNAIFRLTMQGEGNSYLIFQDRRMWVFIKKICQYVRIIFMLVSTYKEK